MTAVMRTYESPLREEQVEQTRDRILAATSRVLSTNDGRLSIPAVAREAGVSVPTVYRHFGTKEELLGALAEWFNERQRLATRRPPANLDELRQFLTAQAAQYAEVDAALRAVMATEAGRKARQGFLPRRKQLVAEGLEPILAGVNDEDKLRVRDVYMLLTSSAGYRTAREFFGYSNAEVADTVVWVVERLARGSRAAKGKRKERG
jgi:AcrR family transcriptional regulator